MSGYVILRVVCHWISLLLALNVVYSVIRNEHIIKRERYPFKTIVLRAIHHSQIVWQESNHHDETTVGIEVNDVKVVVSDKKRSNARYLAAKVCFVDPGFSRQQTANFS